MPSVRTRELQDPQTGQRWSTTCDGPSVGVRTSGPGAGKPRDRTKPLADEAAALQWAYKEEWARIKKGFILNHPQALPGEPRMHRHRCTGYTGALPVADVAGQLLGNCYRPDEGDHLLLFDADGQVTPLPKLPHQCLVWQACCVPSLQTLLVRADRQVLAWTQGDTGFKALAPSNGHTPSGLAVAGTRVVFYAEPALVVRDLASGQTLFSQAVTSEKYGGHSPQMAVTLSPDGATVACCAKAGEILFWDVASARQTATLKADFLMVTDMAYTPDGRHLFVSEQYGACRTLCFDAGAWALRTHQLPVTGNRSSWALSPDGQTIAVADRRHIDLFDVATLQSRLRFPVEHCVKRCEMAWVGPWLGVQTDLGCASLYAVT